MVNAPAATNQPQNQTNLITLKPYNLQISKPKNKMAKIIVNGEAQEVQLPLNLSELIKQNNVLQPEMVSVQVNEDFVDRTEWDSIQLNDGDAVDFLYFMGGGAY